MPSSNKQYTIKIPSTRNVITETLRSSDGQTEYKRIGNVRPDKLNKKTNMGLWYVLISKQQSKVY